MKCLDVSVLAVFGGTDYYVIFPYTVTTSFTGVTTLLAILSISLYISVVFIGDPISYRITDYCNDLERRFR